MEVEPTYRTKQTAQEVDHKTIRMHYLHADRMQGMPQAKFHQFLLQPNSVAKPLETLLNSKQQLSSSLITPKFQRARNVPTKSKLKP